MEKVVVGLNMGMDAVETAWRWKKVAREERWVRPARWDGLHHPYSASRHLDAMGTRPGALGVPTMHPTSLRVCHWGARRRAQPRKVCGYIVSRQLYQGKTMLVRKTAGYANV